MNQLERNSSILSKYLPKEAVPLLSSWIVEFDFKLKITKERRTRLGDYRPPEGKSNHQITINYNLNRFAFLITLVHEIAHLSTWNKHKNTVAPHGTEWKNNFKILMQPFFKLSIFPEDVNFALINYLANPAASSCSDLNLMRVLKKYDSAEPHENRIFLEKLPFKAFFKFNETRLFVKGEKVRTRFKCKEISTGQIYLFNPLTEVELFSNENP